MYKDASYKEKFEDIREWIPYLIDSIKKDLRNDHLKKDFHFVKKFFPSKNIHKVTTEEMAEAYQRAIEGEEKGEDIAEYITSRWLLKHTDLYEFFEKHLTQIDPNFTELAEIEQESAKKLIEKAVSEFGAPQTYLFSVLNSVVFPKESFQRLKTDAQQQQNEKKEESLQHAEKLTADQMRLFFEREQNRLTDKYEKKLAGLQKKYLIDTDSLKKQIAQLQRKLQEKGA